MSNNYTKVTEIAVSGEMDKADADKIANAVFGVGCYERIQIDASVKGKRITYRRKK